MPTELIDRIYECSVVPELWPTVLDDLARLTESRGGLLFSARKTARFGAYSTNTSTRAGSTAAAGASV